METNLVEGKVAGVCEMRSSGGCELGKLLAGRKREEVWVWTVLDVMGNGEIVCLDLRGSACGGPSWAETA